MNETPLILSIESSCDDTSVAILRGREVLSNVVSTQKVHEEFGGVVPELASRAHQKNMVPTVDLAVKKAGVELKQLDAVGFTVGPGLLGSLLVGVSFAKSMALALDVPLITVNHMEAHILAHFIDSDRPQPSFPFICLTVSGGHTQLVEMKSTDQFIVRGETIDDAAGEAFDKIAKIMGLPYPGGPVLDGLAKKGNPLAYSFSLPKVGGYDYSFSGLKTSVLYFLQKQMRLDNSFIDRNKNDICASVQKAILDVLFSKLDLLVKESGIKEVAIAGGVSANSGLRMRLEKKQKEGWCIYLPEFEYCTDNAAMIGIGAYYKFLKKDFANISVAAQARLKITK
ncbi:MAG: N6-L-threonylcarbamoyladenine synthase [Saprospiraceae bacterium]|jgi:N6-L-threonylcarbamoyladenine synthase